jgi:hypothetical protein
MTQRAPLLRTPSFRPALTGVLQRRCACGGSSGRHGECGECREKANPARKRTGAGEQETVSPIVHEALRSPGQPLDPAARAFFEPRFGHDFSQVRVHTEARAAESARAVNALAYTVGRDIVFAGGQYRPQTEEGRYVLAHELAHVVQQGGRSLSPGATFQSRLSKGEDVYEHQADTVARAVNRHVRSDYKVTEYHRLGLVMQKQINGGPPTGGDCSGWEIDHVSFSTNVARYYVETEIDPDLANAGRSVACTDGHYPRAADCTVTFSGNVTVSVGFKHPEREVHAWHRDDKGDWLCRYKYNCTESAELVLSRIRCSHTPSATME